MIALIRGNLIVKAPQFVIVDVHGVGYKVSIPLSAFTRLPPQGEEVTIHTYTHMREDAIQLYGFLTAEERDFFTTLLTISGIGPRMGLNIMSGTSLSNLMEIVDKEDVKRLSMIPGVGKKTAIRLILELKEKLVSVNPPTGRGRIDSRMAADALSALINLGYPRVRAQEAVDLAGKGLAEISLENLIREALKILSSSARGRRN